MNADLSEKERQFMQPNGMKVETKFLPLDLKVIEQSGVFEGYASVFNRVDLGGDLVTPGAFRETLRRRKHTDIKMLFQHDPNQIIGTWDHIQEDQHGLFVKGRILQNLAKGREVHSLMRVGALDGLSIGFRTIKARRIGRRGQRRIEKIDLWEISVVTFPMLPEARIESVKRRPFSRTLPTQREFERWLTRDAGLTRREARAVMYSGFNGLKTLRDAGRGSGEQTRLRDKIREATNLLQCN